MYIFISTHYRRLLSRRHFLPLLLLFLALSTVFLFDNDRRDYFDQIDVLSAKNMAITANLSPDHNFLLFLRRTWIDGTPSYLPYSRWPIGTYALIKLTILPVEDDKATSLYVARLLMLLFFAAATMLAYFALCRLTSDPWIALTATALSFSSYYWLHYNDAVASETSPRMFGIMLTFHGMVIFMQDGRFRQLLVKSCVALLLCWPVMLLLLPFVVLGLAHETLHSYAANSLLPLWSRMRSVAASLFSSRYLILGVVALLFSALVMAFNFTTEYRALNMQLAQLPTTQSIQTQISINPVTSPPVCEVQQFGCMRHFGGPIDVPIPTDVDLDYWLTFLREQFFRIAVLSTPFSLFPLFGYSYPLEILLDNFPDYPKFTYLGIVIFGVCWLGLIFMRHKILMATLLLAGWCWMLPIHHSAGSSLHDFNALMFTGIPLVFFLNGASSLLFILKRLSHRLSRYLIAGLAVATLLILVLSSFETTSYDFRKDAIYAKERAGDLTTIRKITEGKRVLNRGSVYPPSYSFLDANRIVDYYLTGSFINQEETNDFADYMILNIRIDGDALLTPENRQIFLYDYNALSLFDAYQAAYESIVSADPVLRSNFDIYLSENAITYVKETCQETDTQTKFFLHIYPVDTNDLPDHRKPSGFDNFDFWLGRYGARFYGKCMATVNLPEYDIDHIVTGQFISGQGKFWRGEFSVRENTLTASGIDALELEYESIVSAEPVLRSNFDIYLSENAITYVKEACQETDTQAKFFMHIYPIDTNDLPDHRQQHGFDNFDFNFNRRGVKFDGKCLASVDRPAYSIERMVTGQFISGQGKLWEGEFSVDE